MVGRFRVGSPPPSAGVRVRSQIVVVGILTEEVSQNLRS